MMMMYSENNRENLALVLALSRSYQHFLRAIRPVFRSEGLTENQWDVLEVLSTKGALSVNDILRYCLSTSGNLDVVVINLIKKDLVTKEKDKYDRRRRILSLTSKGKDKVKEFYPIHNAALELIFANMQKTEKRNTISNLKALMKTVSKATNPVN